MAKRKLFWDRTPSQRACVNKHRYESLRIARRQAALKSTEFGVSLRAYHCPECKKYHLTHQPQEKAHV